MEDGTEQQGEDWQANDLGNAVAKVYQDAKQKSLIAIQVAVGWSVLLVITGCLGLVEASSASPPLWDFAAGLGMVILAALAVSRTPVPLLIACLVILVDLAVLAFKFPRLLDYGGVGDYGIAAIRLAAAPFVLGFVFNGYVGCLAIEAFKKGFSPGQDWRTRFSPMMLQLTIIGSCVGAILLGLGGWFGAIRSGFARTDVIWATQELFTDPIEIITAPPQFENEVKEAKREGGPGQKAIQIKVVPHDEKEEEVDTAPKLYPASAIPITDDEGLDLYGQKVVEDAFLFGKYSDELECLTEAQGKQDRCRDRRCKHWARIFARACLHKSTETEGFCDEVPDVMLEAAGESWAVNRCAGREYESCRELMYAVQGHCYPPTEEEIEQVAKAALEASPEE